MSDDEETLEDSELPAASDMDDDDDAAADTLPCPHCKKLVYEQTEACPHCGTYLSLEKRAARKPPWFIITVVVCLAVILVVWILR